MMKTETKGRHSWRSLRTLALLALVMACGFSCIKPMDFLVQNFQVTLAPSTGSFVLSIPTAIDPDHSRIIGTGQISQSAVLGTPAPDLETRDLAVHIEIISANQVRVTAHPLRAESTVLRFSILSYIGASGGPNEFTVAARGLIDISEVDGSQEFELVLNAIGVPSGSYDKLTIHHTISVGEATFTTGDEGDLEAPTAFASAILDDNLGSPLADRKAVFRNALLFSPRKIAYEIIDWNGSNWQIERPNTGAGRSAERFVDPGVLNGGVPVSVAINDIGDWDHAWIESNRAAGFGAQTDGIRGAVVYQGADTSSVFVLMPFQSGGASGVPNEHGFYVISNPDVYVLHQGMPLGDSSTRLDNTEVEQLFTLKEPNEINLGPDQVVSLAYGYWDKSENNTVGDDLQGVGTAGITSIFSAPASVIASKSVASGWWYHHIQTIQFSREAGPDGSLLQSVIDRPKVSIDFKAQRS